jgi:alpha-glucosidase
MRNSWKLSVTLAAAALSMAVTAQAQSSFDLKSPDKRIELRIRTAQGVRYDVVLNGRAILENSSLSIDVDHKMFGKDTAKVLRSKERSHDETLEPVVRQKFARIRDHYNELRVEFDGGHAVTFRAYNEGVAYRLETSLPQPEVKVYGEEMNLNFSANDVVFYPQEDSFMSHN